MTKTPYTTLQYRDEGYESQELNSVASSATAEDDLDKTATSVHWLTTGFMEELRTAGFHLNSKIYEIEDLKGPPGLIRTKGANVVSPVDNKMGASYVHCLEGADNVGTANFMLSYTWGYSIGDIVDALGRHCQKNGLDPKRTYIWICCLCINQHRLVEQDTKSLEFFVQLKGYLTGLIKGIRHVLAMMSPWNDPYYLTRIWCVFEVYIATQNECEVTVVMPSVQQKKFEESLYGKDGTLSVLYEALDKIKIEQANASNEDDRIGILNLVKSDPGYTIVNTRVKKLLEHWFLRAEEERKSSQQGDTITTYGRFLTGTGLYPDRIEQPEAVVEDETIYASRAQLNEDERVALEELELEMEMSSSDSESDERALEELEL